VLTGTPRLFVAESAAAYAKRPRVVADASVVVALLFDEQDQEEALARLGGRLVAAPHLLDLEFANAAVKKMRRERLDAGRVAEALQMLDEVVADRHPVPAAAALELAQRYGLTPYDAAYLWLAERLEVPLVTFDARLGEAARRHLEGVPEGG
jgi:predicted nucleic acid-binding protein